MLLRLFGEDFRLAQLDAPAVDAYVRARRDEGTSDHTIHKELTTLRAALRLALRARLWSGSLDEVLPERFGAGYRPLRQALAGRAQSTPALARGIDLSPITDVVLSHWHTDHTGGLVTLRRELMKQNGAALSRAHVGRGFFWPRKVEGKISASVENLKKDYQALGGSFVEHVAASELLPGVWLTGEVPRRTAERNFPKGREVRLPDGRWVEDDVPDDLSLVLDSAKGLVVVTGCGHAGVVNTVEIAKERVREGPVFAIIGGLHLFASDDARVDWTANELKRFGLTHLIGAHCTGIEALMRFRHGAGLNRRTAVVGAVGASFNLETGIDPRDLAR